MELVFPIEGLSSAARLGNQIVGCREGKTRAGRKEGAHRKGMDIALPLVATAVAIASLLFTAVATRHLGKQTTLLAATSELSFNLGVMVRLQEVLFAVADDPESFDRLWGKECVENTRSQVAVQSLLDVLSMAMAAVERLPGFSRNNDDWSSYTAYVFERSPRTRQEVLEHPEWWPELVSSAEAVLMRAEGYGNHQ